MPFDLSKWGPLTVLVVVIVSAAAVGGVVVVIAAPDTLNFHQYLDELKTFVLALAALAGAHGLLGAGQKIADAHQAASALNALARGSELPVESTKAEGFQPAPEA